MPLIEQLQSNAQNMMEQMDLKWRQRAKEVWLVHGNKNSKYFHVCASQRRHTNLITSILDGEGVQHDDATGIEEAFVNHFKCVLTSSIPIGIEECIQVLPGRVSATMNQQLLGKVSDEEVK